MQNFAYLVRCDICLKKLYFNGEKVRGAVHPARVGKKLNDLREADTNASLIGQIYSMEGKEAQKTVTLNKMNF